MRRAVKIVALLTEYKILITALRQEKDFGARKFIAVSYQNLDYV